MKKRLLALALCLVMMTSLLPVTAAAEGLIIKNVCVRGNGLNDKNNSWLNGLDWDPSELNFMNQVSPNVYEITYKNVNRSGDLEFLFCLYEENDDWRVWKHYLDGTFVGSGVATNAVYNTQYHDIKFSVPYNFADITLRLDLRNFDATTKEGATFTITITDVHNWKFTISESRDKLTAKCQNQECGKEVSVSLKADSVTLPNSPFNARLEGWEQLVSEFPEAKYKFDYKYKGPGDSEYRPVDPIAANAKAGEYQVGVSLWDITRGPIDPSEGTYLFVKYTAVDPKVTAQTGDNRPIELMMGIVVVFSVLAAAAFIADSKRRAQQ